MLVNFGVYILFSILNDKLYKYIFNFVGKKVNGSSVFFCVLEGGVGGYIKYFVLLFFKFYDYGLSGV